MGDRLGTPGVLLSSGCFFYGAKTYQGIVLCSWNFAHGFPLLLFLFFWKDFSKNRSDRVSGAWGEFCVNLSLDRFNVAMLIKLCTCLPTYQQQIVSKFQIHILHIWAVRAFLAIFYLGRGHWAWPQYFFLKFCTVPSDTKEKRLAKFYWHNFNTFRVIHFLVFKI
jgi:hypothetical protein